MAPASYFSWSVRIGVGCASSPSKSPPTLVKLVDILDSEEGPCEVVAHADSLDPSSICG